MYGTTNQQAQINPQIRQWFEMVDTDCSGKITDSELQKALANGQGGTFSDIACQLMISLFDKEKKGTINLEEFQALFNYVTSWLEVFRGFDHDNSCSIEEDELSAALIQMGYRLSREFIKFLIKRSDSTEGKKITVDQFIVFCVQLQKFTEAFRDCDKAQSGTITIGYEEFLKIVLQLSI